VSEDRESLLALQLSQISPNLVAVGGDLTDLGKVKAQLAEAEQRYTPDHPDVKRLRRVMEDLIAKNSTGNARTVKPNNPEYLQIESQLTGVRRDLTALRASASRVNQQIGTYVQNMGRSPVVEKEFADINRRREALQGNYQQLQDRLRSAQLAQSFESESRGERFSLVRAPFPAKLPFSPNRIGLILLGLVLGLGLTAAVVAIVESNDTTVRGTSDLPMHGEAIHLGTIPMILIAADRRRRTLLWGTVAGAYGLAVVFVGISIVSAG
jgi:uncharacterized protein involved in exopolysaccharide biosynthesis